MAQDMGVPLLPELGCPGSALFGFDALARLIVYGARRYAPPNTPLPDRLGVCATSVPITEVPARPCAKGICCGTDADRSGEQ